MTHRVFRHFSYFSYNAFRHCLLSYVFGTATLATTINLVVGIVTD